MMNKIKFIVLIILGFPCGHAYSQTGKINSLKQQLSDSAIHSAGELVNGRKNGAWIYYRNGNIVRTSYFNLDTLTKVTVFFHDNGNVARVVPIENGLVSGEVKFYSTKGELIAILLYEKDGFVRTIFRKADSESPPQGHDFFPLDDY